MCYDSYHVHIHWRRSPIKGQPSTLPHKHQYFPLRIGSKWLPAGNFLIFKSLSTDEFLELEGRIRRKMTAKFYTFQRAYACLPVLSTIESSSKISFGGSRCIDSPPHLWQAGRLLVNFYFTFTLPCWGSERTFRANKGHMVRSHMRPNLRLGIDIPAPLRKWKNKRTIRIILS